ncbi:MAG TPA: AraC family transcriptional regulator ligand-binding domain-containing protein, partial [Solimonas sp.]|nr:AraC family transcriptional regulator ligand-binding domain-containing protein [Solimonas sp.]
MALGSSALPALPPLMLAPAGITGRYLREMLPSFLPPTLLTGAGINPERLARDELYRVPLYQVQALLEQVLRAVPDPLFALRQTRGLSLKAYPWLGASLLASVDLRTGLERLIELEPLVWDGSRIELSQQGEQACLRWIELQPLPPAMVEMALAGWILLAPTLAQVPAGEVRLHFRHAARAPLEAYEAVLGCRPQFDQPDISLHFPAAWLTRAMTHSDPTAGEWLLAEARRRLAEGPETWLLESRVRALCLGRLPGELPEAAAIAQELAMTPRVLRDRLQ